MVNVGDLNLGVKVDTSPLDGLGNSLKKIASLAAAAFSAAKIVEFGKAAIDAFSKFEQLEGGINKLYGENSKASQQMMENAKNAYKTVQMSQNEYMETATQFSAAMINSLGGDTEAAAAQVDKAITQMRDNASIMGTDIEMIETAYKGFARQSYLALDNLKLGRLCA